MMGRIIAFLKRVFGIKKSSNEMWSATDGTVGFEVNLDDSAWQKCIEMLNKLDSPEITFEFAHTRSNQEREVNLAALGGIPVIVSEFLPDDTIMIASNLAEKIGWKKKINPKECAVMTIGNPPEASK